MLCAYSQQYKSNADASMNASFWHCRHIRPTVTDPTSIDPFNNYQIIFRTIFLYFGLTHYQFALCRFCVVNMRTQ